MATLVDRYLQLWLVHRQHFLLVKGTAEIKLDSSSYSKIQICALTGAEPILASMKLLISAFTCTFASSNSDQ